MMNSVQIVGNLTKDPQIRVTKTGTAVASFSVAVNRFYVTPQGEKRQLTDFVNVVAWGGLAESVGNNLKRGNPVYVEGRYSTRSYQAKDGSRRYVTEVVANTVAVPLSHKNQQAQQPQQPVGSGFDQFGQSEPDRYNPHIGGGSEEIPF